MDRRAADARVAYRPPLAWAPLLRFLEARAIAGVELVGAERYARTASMGGEGGWFAVTRDPARAELLVHVSPSLLPALTPLLAGVRAIFDAEADPDAIAAHLGADPLLAGTLERLPGLRVPGAFDAFELCVRAILGQQVSVKRATGLAGRYAAAFGEPLATPLSGLERLTPTAGRVAAAEEAEVRAIGLPGARARAIMAAAEAFASGRVALAPGDDPEAATQALEALPGIGPWTAQYVAMRALRAPDAFPGGDLVLRRALGDPSPAAVRARAEGWRPFRAYAALALWNATPEELAAG